MPKNCAPHAGGGWRKRAAERRGAAPLALAGSRGYAFGVHKALDKAGAVLGPLLAGALWNCAPGLAFALAAALSLAAIVVFRMAVPALPPPRG